MIEALKIQTWWQVEGIRWKDKIRNEDVLEKIEEGRTLLCILNRRQREFGLNIHSPTEKEWTTGSGLKGTVDGKKKRRRED